MALTDNDRNLIFNMSQQLLTQDMLTSSIFSNSSVGKSLRDMVLSKPSAQPLTNPFEEAITGTLRADTAAVRQNSRNVGEAAGMMGTAKSAMGNIKTALEEMEDIIDKINAGELDGTSSIVQDEYDALKTKVDGIISNTDYNGIYMLDSDKWGTVQINSSGQVWIQAFKDGGYDISFNAVNGLSNLGDLAGSDLGDAGTMATQLSYVQSLQSDVDAIKDRYTTKHASLEYESNQLESQAVILAKAVENRRTSETSVEQVLLDLILKQTGTIVDDKS